MFKKLTITSIVAVAIASAQPVQTQTQTSKIGDIGVSISPTFSNFKGKNGGGISVTGGNNKFILNYQNLNGNFNKKQLGIENKYLFFAHQKIKTDKIDKKVNNFIGLKYYYYLKNLFATDDFNSHNSPSLAFLEAKAGISINNNNPFLASASFNYLKKLTKNNLIGYAKIGATRYNFGTEFSAQAGLAFSF